LAVTGSPPFSMFQSEFTILRAGFDGAQYGPAIIFVGLLAVIFAGFLAHIARLVLGPDPGLPPAAPDPWKKYPVIALASLVVVIGFWLPGPVYELIRNAARIVTGEP